MFEKVSFLGHKKMVKEDSVVFGGMIFFFCWCFKINMRLGYHDL